MRHTLNMPAQHPSGSGDGGYQQDSDPHARYVGAYGDLLEHARWLIEAQERRGAGFQQTAVAVLGFDGVILAILIGLTVPETATGAQVAATVVAALAVIGSAVLAVLALVPRSVSVASTDQLIDQWRSIFDPQAPERPSQGSLRAYLVATILSQDLEPGTSEGAATKTSAISPEEKSGAPRQPLDAATRVADKRAGHLKWSAWSLLLGLAAIVVAWAVST